MKFKRRYLAAASCILVIVVIASTAGCTSSSTSSNQQASTAAANRQADPNPSDMPVYSPSQRMNETLKSDYSTAYLYHTSDTVSQVTSFYKTQMPKLGYTLNVTSDRPDYSYITYQKQGKNVAIEIRPVKQLDSNSNVTSIAANVMDV